MLHKIKKTVWLQDLQRFMENFESPPKLELECFHPVQLPVVITEAHVKMRTVQDYSVLSLLILRLFDAGIRTPEAIQSISGMSLETVKAYIQKEQLLLEHIDPKTNELTELGRMTLAANTDLQGDKAMSCQHYDSVLRVHIDPLTASLIPQYLEWELADNITPNEDAGDFLNPRETAPTDPDFLRELNTRLLADINGRMEEHVSCDAVKNGNILDSITAFRPIRIFFRWGYLAKFAGMTRPMIVFSGKKTVDNINADSVVSGVQNQFVTVPIALAQSDKDYLAENGIIFHKVLQRSDDCFDALIEMTRNMNLTLPDSDEAEEQTDIPEEVTEESLVEPDWEESAEDVPVEADPEEPDMHTDEDDWDEEDRDEEDGEDT